MKVSEAVAARRSCRAFLDKPVDQAVVREVLEKAARTASGGNLQPWRVYLLTPDTLADFKAQMANWPLARTWVPALVGEWREWEPHNELQGKYWTTRTQNVAALPMMALVKHVREVDLGAIDLPVLVIYSRDDVVVSAEKTEAAMERWGGPKEMHVRVMSDADTPSHHVIAGDIMSPTQTAGTVEIISSWADGVLGR